MLVRIAGINVPKSKDHVSFVAQGFVAEKSTQLLAMGVTDHLEVMEPTSVLLKVHYIKF